MEHTYIVPPVDFRNYLSAQQNVKIASSIYPNQNNNKGLDRTNKNRSLFNGIFTVADSLKEEYIIKTLQPDLGSLDKFINLKEEPDFENYRQSLINMRFHKKTAIFYSHFFSKAKK